MKTCVVKLLPNKQFFLLERVYTRLAICANDIEATFVPHTLVPESKSRDDLSTAKTTKKSHRETLFLNCL